MRFLTLKTLTTVLIASMALVSLSAIHTLHAKTLHEERSLYQKVLVEEDGVLRCLRFTKKNRKNLNQSCVFTDDADELVFSYYQQSLAGNYFTDKPENILIIGLGGGILANTYHKLYPQAQITSVEIDSVVVYMARKYFDYDDSNPQLTTHTRDGRVFVKRAQRKEQRYDLIILDAFNSDYIPEHLMSQEYLQEVKSLLTEKGIVMANTFSTSALYDHESSTYHAVFGNFYQVSSTNGKTNRVIIAGNQPLASLDSIETKVSSFAEPFIRFGVDSEQLFEAISDKVEWNKDAEVLTDQFSPANLLKSQ